LHDRGHELVGHEWMPRNEFLGLCRMMDIGMQVSFSETFNIVAADLINQGVPVVVSKEVPWASGLFCADPTDSNDIFRKLRLTTMIPGFNTWMHRHLLNNYTDETRKHWLKYFKKDRRSK